jgi:predicted RNA-binding Zn ribbon-like protein
MRAVETMPLVGGSVCLDLLNTTGARDTAAPRERLHTYDDLVVWSRRAGLLTAAESRTASSRAARRPTEAAAGLARILAVRERLYRMMRAIAGQRTPDPPDVAWLDRWWRRGQQKRTLVAGGHALEVRDPRAVDAFDGVAWPVIQSAVDLLTSGAVSRLKRCGECDWLFVDDSKNQSRTWCKKECGDRVRARRHYRRVRETPRRRKPAAVHPVSRVETAHARSRRRTAG